MPRPPLKQRLAVDPGAVFETIAAEESVSCRDVVEALPDEMRHFVDGGLFEAVMTDVARWGAVTFIVHTEDGIFEFSCAVPKGSVSRGNYNLSGRDGLHGHIRYNRCAAIAFVERPFMSRNSAVIVFFNVDGGIMFKIFVSRDRDGALIADQLAVFRALSETVTQPERATETT